jgi:hypothetical protein
MILARHRRSPSRTANSTRCSPAWPISIAICELTPWWLGTSLAHRASLTGPPSDPRRAVRYGHNMEPPRSFERDIAVVSAEEQARLTDAYFRGVSLTVLAADFGLRAEPIQALVLKTRGKLAGPTILAVRYP